MIVGSRTRARISPWWQLIVDIVLLSRPSMWPASLLPYCLGSLLVTHRLIPTEPIPFFAGAVVFGPLAWLYILAVNDIHDAPGDSANERLSHLPVQCGRMSPRLAATLAGVAVVLALIVAALLGLAFLVMTVAFMSAALAYSAPPVRLKTRPGADVAANAIAMGVVAMLAGWLVNEPIGGFPWVMLAQGLAVGIAVYVPTTILDYESDRAAGYTTFAVRWGPGVAYRTGMAAWIACNLGSLLLAWHGIVFPERMVPVLLVTVPVLIAAYHFGIGMARGQRRVRIGLVVVNWLFMVPTSVFALMYAGTV